MSIDVRRIVLQVALRTLQLAGTDQDTIEASYNVLLTSLDGADVPLSAFKDAVLAIEAQLTGVIASDRTHPYRSLFYGRSQNLLPGAKMPTESNELLRFVGIFSGLKDASDSLPLTEAPIEEVRRFLRGNYQTEIYNYAIAGERVYHTRANAYFEGCCFSGSIARQRFDAPYQLSPIPEVLESTWVAGTLELMVQEGWLQAEGAHYGNLYNRGIAMLKDRNFNAPEIPAIEVTPKPSTN